MDDRADEKQPEPSPRLFAFQFIPRAVKPLENDAAQVSWDAGAIVGYRQRRISFDALEVNVNVRWSPRVFDRIVQ